jgi:2-polyprenyl-6-methoxyphenol hydroxylase-like FAD-dependent oxidoreductase
MLPDRTDILIVGAGPTGLALGVCLAQQGCNFTLVDQQAAGANTSRAAVVHANTLEVLETLGVTEELLERGHVVPRFSVRSRDTRLIDVDFGTLPSQYPFTLMVPQDVTEAVLLRRLEALGGRIHRPWEVIDLLEDHDGINVTLRNGDGETSCVHAQYVVGADGMHSIVRQAARIPFDGSVYEDSFVLADVIMDWPLARDEVNLFFSPEGLVVVAALPQDRYRIVATADEAPPEPALQDVQALLDARGPCDRKARVHEVIWSSRFRVHHRLAGRYHRGRAVLVGDAAHVHSPAGGQGMNTGIVDACVLGPRLADIVAGRRDHGALDEYEALRRPVAEHVLALSNRGTRAATLRNPLLRMLRNLALRCLNLFPRFKHALACDLSGINQQRG